MASKQRAFANCLSILSFLSLHLISFSPLRLLALNSFMPDIYSLLLTLCHLHVHNSHTTIRRESTIRYVCVRAVCEIWCRIKRFYHFIISFFFNKIHRLHNNATHKTFCAHAIFDNGHRDTQHLLFVASIDKCILLLAALASATTTITIDATFVSAKGILQNIQEGRMSTHTLTQHNPYTQTETEREGAR